MENGHTISGLEILEKWAIALRIPLYQLLYDGNEPPQPLKLFGQNHRELCGNSGRQTHELKRLRQYLSKMNDEEREVLLSLAGRMVTRQRRKAGEAVSEAQS